MRHILRASSVELQIPPSFPDDTAAQTFKWFVLWWNGQICSSSLMLNQSVSPRPPISFQMSQSQSCKSQSEIGLSWCNTRWPLLPWKAALFGEEKRFLAPKTSLSLPNLRGHRRLQAFYWVLLELILLTCEIDWLQAPGKQWHKQVTAVVGAAWQLGMDLSIHLMDGIAFS